MLFKRLAHVCLQVTDLKRTLARITVPDARTAGWLRKGVKLVPRAVRWSREAGETRPASRRAV